MALTVSFYHLTLTPIEKVVPRLVDKIYASNMRAFIWVKNDETLSTLNTSLWTYSTLAFLPHGCKLDHDDAKDEQPIWLSTTLENVNKSTVCVVTNEKVIPKADSLKFDRILDIFDATSKTIDAEAVLLTERIRFYEKQNATITHWQQTKEGWQKLT
ncbi:MAG: DNA polymerase III subunit chi [Candidatus Paracaedibacteraceae bacterium]|nr:DNA polymerase III subunit chi [Candidatus Paracaedibacteraceae bacterium]